uniref:Zinc finger and SCAN domain-containing protein 4 n=1 Tax=Sciurus vulgaris TaxID=55149 RepID=A0A8D2DAZ2_SCIVU
MALDFGNSSQCERSQNNLELGNTEGEIISEFSSSQLNSLQCSGVTHMQGRNCRLHEIFHSWLQREKHNKDEIISQFVLEQFRINGNFRDKSILKKKWESTGRNLEKLMEDLTDDCMKPPVLVHVHMQGQEALFSENMPLREAIVHLKRQLSAETTGEHIEIPLLAPQETPLETKQGNEDKEGGCNNSWKHTQVNDSITCQETQIPSLLIIQEENHPRLEEGGASCKNPHNSTKVVMSNSEEGTLKEPSYQNVPVEVQPGFLPRSDQSSSESVPAHQSNKRNSACKGHQEKCHGAQKSYKCEGCPKIFRHPCHFLAHQRRHRNERPFVCAECQKGFFQMSDLHVHHMIHTKEKSFKCSICEKSFSHKTNLRACERIHTGEKPYTCSLCQRSYCQSSTYHRHLRIHQKIRHKSVSSTPKASSATTPM